MPTTSETISPSIRVNGQSRERKWFAVLGIALLFAGGIASANLFYATLVSILFIAGTMFAGGMMQVFHAFRTHEWRNRLLYLLSGLFYAAAGATGLYDPILSAAGVSLAFGVLLIGSGILRIVFGAREQGESGRAWIVASGAFTLASGAFILAAWPLVSLWLLGLIVTFDLIFQGWGFVAYGLGFGAEESQTSADTQI